MKHQLHITNTKGGSKIVFVDVPGSSSYYFNTICNGGYNYAQKEKYELPHLLEHLAFEGTSNYPDASKMYYELERLGGWSNASTSEQNIRYFLVGSIKDYRAISALALEQYTQPLFRAKNIKEQKQVVEREFKRQIDDDGTRVRALNYTRFFPDKISFPKDSIATLKNITRDDILDFYKATHTQANTLFVIAGDLNSKRRHEISLMVEKAMQPLPRGKKLRKFHRLATDELTKSKALASKLEGQANFSMAFIIPDYLEDIKSRAIMAVASAIYNRGDSSRIFRKAREAGLAYTVDSGIYSGPDYGELYIIDKTDPKLTAKLLDLCLKELLDITKGNISNAELERAKGYMAGEYDTEYETSREIANWYGPQFAADEPIFSPQDFSNAIRSVQKTDVIKMLHKFVRPDNWIFGLVANSPKKLLKTCEQVITKNLATLS